ncbi:MAG: START domain-containing protein [Salibacteraceae bacterium]
MKVLYFTLLAFIASQNPWTLRKDEDGIKVYSRPVPYSNYDAYKAEMVLECDLNLVKDFLRNQPRYRQVFPDVEVLEIVEILSENEWILYTLTDVPWPASDRDGYFRSRFRHHNGRISITSEAVPDYGPENEGVVRVRKSESKWLAYKTPDGKVYITYEVAAEPGGDIPGWLIKTAAHEVPYKTFQNLRKALSSAP